MPLPNLVGWDPPVRMRVVLVSAALLVGAGSIAFAIVRQSFLDLGTVMRRAILLSGISGSLVILYFLTARPMDRILVVQTGREFPIFQTLFVILVIVFFHPILGRVEEIKGTHLAVEVARKSGRALVIAGNIPDGDQHQEYFRKRIAPFVDERSIRYVGPVDDGSKNDLLGRSLALLMPILWEEPFGIVMAEALACGTPVVATDCPTGPREILENGKYGPLVPVGDSEALADALLTTIAAPPPRTLMEEAAGRFAVDTIAEHYFDVLYSVPEQIKKALDENNSEIPFPHRKVIVVNQNQ